MITDPYVWPHYFASLLAAALRLIFAGVSNLPPVLINAHMFSHPDYVKRYLHA